MNTTLRILAPVAAAAVVLTGCGLAENAVEGAVEQAVEQGVEGATGADVEAGEDGFSVKTDEGEFTVGSDGSLPEGFPESEVPLVDGEIIQTAKMQDGGSDGYAVTLNVASDLVAVHEDAVAKLEGAGFTVGADVDMGEMRSTTFEGSGAVAGVTLGVVAAAEEGQSTASYTVIMASAE